MTLNQIWAGRAAAWALSAVFLVAAGSKFVHFEKFIILARSLPLVPVVGEVPFAQAVILVELAIGVALLVPAAGIYASRAALGLSIVFALYNLARIPLGMTSLCPCFPETLKMSVGTGLVLNLVMIGLAVLTGRTARHVTLSRELASSV